MSETFELRCGQSAIIAQLLVDKGWGSDPDEDPLLDWPVYHETEPDKPDNCIVVYNTQGTDSGREQITGQSLDHHGLMIQVRCSDPTTGNGKAQYLRHQLLTDLQRVVVTVPDWEVSTTDRTYRVACASDVKPINSLGYESGNKRRLWTINFKAVIARLT